MSRTQNLCLQQMLRAGKRGNICVGNNVSSFARALKSVPFLHARFYSLFYVLESSRISEKDQREFPENNGA